MKLTIPTAADLMSELMFTTSRSSGPGGQNVNKVNSKVTLKFDIEQSVILLPEQREHLLVKLAAKLTGEGVLILTAQDKRSQLQNKEEVMQKLDRLLIKTFTPRKPRKATKPSKAAKLARINNKKQQSEKKQWRQKIG